MSKVSVSVGELGLERGVQEHEPERLLLLRELLRNNLEQLRRDLPDAECFLEKDCRVQLVAVRYRRVVNASKLPHEQRLLCVAIAGQPDVAVPVAPPRLELRVEASGASAVLVTAEEMLKMTFHKELHAPRTISLLPTLDFSDLDTLMKEPREPRVEQSVVMGNGAFGAMHANMPRRLTECYADVAQDHWRLHTLACLDKDNTPIVLEGMQLRQVRPSEDCRKWRTYLRSDIHASSLTCACAVNGRVCKPGRTCLELSFCGRDITDGKCKTHPGMDNEGQDVCMANLKACFYCRHDDESEGFKTAISLADRLSLPVVRAIATAGVTIATYDEVEEPCCTLVEEALEEAETGLSELKPSPNEMRDKRALHALRARSAIRKPNGRLASRAGQTPRWLCELSDTYAHLFAKA